VGAQVRTGRAHQDREQEAASAHRCPSLPVCRTDDCHRHPACPGISVAARNRHLADALYKQAFCALTASPAARAYYDQLRARGASHHAALRQLASRLAHRHPARMPQTRASYDEATAWQHRLEDAA